MADGKIEIETGIDQSGVNKGVKQVDKTLKKSAKSFTSSFAKMRDVMLGPVAGIALLKGGLDKVKATIDELTEAYKTQIKAETQLESAAANNPYLNESSVQGLKDYASEIQSYSTYGDEELLPMMAKLAAAGRTQDEIFAIMTTATDMAASGAFSLDSAVSNLNKSYGGLSGELGESIPEIKDLTAEQLKNGAAVELLAGRYQGIAKDVANATGASEQLANTIGDFKESLGSLTLPAANQWDMFFKGFVEKGISAVDSFNEYWDKKRRKNIGKQVASLATGVYSSGETGVDFFTDEELKNAVEYLDSLKQMNATQEDTYITIKSELGHRERIAAYAEKEAAAEAEKNKQAAESLSKDQQAIDIINANTAAREQALATLQATADAKGETVDIQDKLNAYVQSYVSLVTQNPDLITENNTAAKELLATTKEIAEEAKKETTEYDKISNAMETLSTMSGDAYDNMKQGIIDDINATDLDIEKKKELLEVVNGISEATAGIDFADALQSSISSILSSFSDLGEELANNDLEWKDLGATALNTLSSIMSAMASQLEGYAAAALVKSLLSTLAPELAIPIALAGAAALYTASGFASAKAESFTTGGVIGGTSYTGDKLLAPVNSKERVLTPQQNATFEKLVYDGASISGGLSTADITGIAEAVASVYNQTINTDVYLDKRVMAKAITTVQKNGDF